MTTRSLTLALPKRKHWREDGGLWGLSDAALAPNHRKFQRFRTARGNRNAGVGARVSPSLLWRGGLSGQAEVLSERTQ